MILCWGNHQYVGRFVFWRFYAGWYMLRGCVGGSVLVGLCWGRKSVLRDMFWPICIRIPVSGSLSEEACVGRTCLE